MDWLKLLKHKLKRARELSAADWLTLIEAWWRLSFFHAALLATSYDRLEDSTRAADSSAQETSRAEAEHLHRLIQIAAQIHLIPMRCLVQALTLQKMLSARNIPAQIKIGAQKTQGILYAHAWVEVDQQPIGEAEDITERFNILRQSSVHVL